MKIVIDTDDIVISANSAGEFVFDGDAEKHLLNLIETQDKLENPDAHDGDGRFSYRSENPPPGKARVQCIHPTSYENGKHRLFVKDLRSHPNRLCQARVDEDLFRT